MQESFHPSSREQNLDLDRRQGFAEKRKTLSKDLSNFLKILHQDPSDQVATTKGKEKRRKGPASKEQKIEFIQTIAPIAKKVGTKFGLPWQAILLQAILESGWDLSKKTLHGIKKYRKDLPSFATKTKEFRNGKMKEEIGEFQDFGGGTQQEKIINSCIGYCQFLLNNKRYKKAINTFRNGGTPRNFVKLVADAGYATDPNYYNSLSNIAKSNDIDIDNPQTFIDEELT